MSSSSFLLSPVQTRALRKKDPKLEVITATVTSADVVGSPRRMTRRNSTSTPILQPSTPLKSGTRGLTPELGNTPVRRSRRISQSNDNANITLSAASTAFKQNIFAAVKEEEDEQQKPLQQHIEDKENNSLLVNESEKVGKLINAKKSRAQTNVTAAQHKEMVKKLTTEMNASHISPLSHSAKPKNTQKDVAYDEDDIVIIPDTPKSIKSGDAKKVKSEPIERKQEEEVDTSFTLLLNDSIEEIAESTAMKQYSSNSKSDTKKMEKQNTPESSNNSSSSRTVTSHKMTTNMENTPARKSMNKKNISFSSAELKSEMKEKAAGLKRKTPDTKVINKSPINSSINKQSPHNDGSLLSSEKAAIVKRSSLEFKRKETSGFFETQISNSPENNKEKDASIKNTPDIKGILKRQATPFYKAKTHYQSSGGKSIFESGGAGGVVAYKDEKNTNDKSTRAPTDEDYKNNTDSASPVLLGEKPHITNVTVLQSLKSSVLAKIISNGPKQTDDTHEQKSTGNKSPVAMNSVESLDKKAISFNEAEDEQRQTVTYPKTPARINARSLVRRNDNNDAKSAGKKESLVGKILSLALKETAAPVVEPMQTDEQIVSEIEEPEQEQGKTTYPIGKASPAEQKEKMHGVISNANDDNPNVEPLTLVDNGKELQKKRFSFEKSMLSSVEKKTEAEAEQVFKETSFRNSWNKIVQVDADTANNKIDRIQPMEKEPQTIEIPESDEEEGVMGFTPEFSPQVSDDENEDYNDTDEEGPNNKSVFVDDEAIEMKDYESGDSLSEGENQEMQENEIIDIGESIGSATDDDDENKDDEEYEKDSFVVSSDEEVEEEKDIIKKKTNGKYKRIQVMSDESEASEETVSLIDAEEDLEPEVEIATFESLAKSPEIPEEEKMSTSKKILSVSLSDAKEKVVDSDKKFLSFSLSIGVNDKEEDQLKEPVFMKSSNFITTNNDNNKQDGDGVKEKKDSFHEEVVPENELQVFEEICNGTEQLELDEKDMEENNKDNEDSQNEENKTSEQDEEIALLEEAGDVSDDDSKHKVSRRSLRKSSEQDEEMALLEEAGDVSDDDSKHKVSRRSLRKSSEQDAKMVMGKGDRDESGDDSKHKVSRRSLLKSSDQDAKVVVETGDVCDDDLKHKVSRRSLRKSSEQDAKVVVETRDDDESDDDLKHKVSRRSLRKSIEQDAKMVVKTGDGDESDDDSKHKISRKSLRKSIEQDAKMVVKTGDGDESDDDSKHKISRRSLRKEINNDEEDYKQLEKLKQHHLHCFSNPLQKTKRQSLIIPESSRNNNEESALRRKSISSVHHAHDFNPSRSFVETLQEKKLSSQKRKRLSKSFSSATDAALAQDMEDDIPHHIHKKSKIALVTDYAGSSNEEEDGNPQFDLSSPLPYDEEEDEQEEEVASPPKSLTYEEEEEEVASPPKSLAYEEVEEEVALPSKSLTDEEKVEEKEEVASSPKSLTYEEEEEEMTSLSKSLTDEEEEEEDEVKVTSFVSASRESTSINYKNYYSSCSILEAANQAMLKKLKHETNKQKRKIAKSRVRRDDAATAVATKKQAKMELKKELKRLQKEAIAKALSASACLLNKKKKTIDNENSVRNLKRRRQLARMHKQEEETLYFVNPVENIIKTASGYFFERSVTPVIGNRFIEEFEMNSGVIRVEPSSPINQHFRIEPISPHCINPAGRGRYIESRRRGRDRDDGDMLVYKVSKRRKH